MVNDWPAINESLVTATINTIEMSVKNGIAIDKIVILFLSLGFKNCTTKNVIVRKIANLSMAF